jgi:mxaJ protein
MSLVTEIARSVCVAMLTLSTCGSVALAAPALRVCADPNNLPYSNEKRQGFENRLADMIAQDLGMQVSYFWFPQREAFFRKTLNSGACDVVMGVPASGFDEADTTRPYYRSSYVFVAKRSRALSIKSFDDPKLRTLRIGVHVLGNEDDSLPPVHALISRHIVRNLVGYSIFGNLTEQDPAADLIRAVEAGDVDVAIAWGPLAGYFAQRSTVPLTLTAVAGDPMHPQLPFSFDIGIGVRAGDEALRKQLDAEIVRRQSDIRKLLTSFGIPQTSPSPQRASLAEN